MNLVFKFRSRCMWLFVILTWAGARVVSAQGLIVDQASGDPAVLPQNSSLIPQATIAQSFTPSFSAVGWVQFSDYVMAIPGNDTVTLVVNLHEGSWDGPIVSSTDPVLLVNHLTQIGTFYFPANIPITAGQLYFFEPVVVSGGVLAIGYFAPSSYTRGDAWNNGVSSQGTSDYWFREGIVMIPEPGTVTLLILGLCGLLVRTRSGRNC